MQLIEAGFDPAIINYQNTGNNKVYLTLVGGGVFGNRSEWIIDIYPKEVHDRTWGQELDSSVC